MFFRIFFRLFITIITAITAYPVKEIKTPVYTNLTNSLIGFDCSDINSGHTVLSLLNQQNCEPNTTDITSSSVNLKIIKTETYDKINYFECLISANIQITKCGKWYQGRNSFVKHYNTISTPSYVTCLEMHDRLFFTHPNYPHIIIPIKNNHGAFNGFIKGSLKDNDYEGTEFMDDHHTLHTNVYVHMDLKVRINKNEATLNIEDKALILANGLRCDYTLNTCFDTIYGQAYWTTETKASECYKKPLIIIYDGPVNKTIERTQNNITKIAYFSIDEDRLFFIEAIAETKVCGYPGHKTQHPNIFTLEGFVFNSKKTKKKDSL